MLSHQYNLDTQEPYFCIVKDGNCHFFSCINDSLLQRPDNILKGGGGDMQC